MIARNLVLRKEIVEGKCFDCGKLVPLIHKHHPNRPAPETMALCPTCHIRRHRANGDSAIPITQYLSEKQREIVLSHGEQERAELDALELKFEQRRTKIRDKYSSRRLRLIKKLCGNPNYTLLNYPYPIWNLHFFKYLRPKEVSIGPV